MKTRGIQTVNRGHAKRRLRDPGIKLRRLLEPQPDNAGEESPDLSSMREVLFLGSFLAVTVAIVIVAPYLRDWLA